MVAKILQESKLKGIGIFMGNPLANLRKGANLDRRLVPYTRDARRIKSRIEFIP